MKFCKSFTLSRKRLANRWVLKLRAELWTLPGSLHSPHGLPIDGIGFTMAPQVRWCVRLTGQAAGHQCAVPVESAWSRLLCWP